MLKKVNNSAAFRISNCNEMLAVVYKSITPDKTESTRCRFDMFVRVRPGIPSPFPNQQRTWCYRGDKFTDEEHKMLRNLLNLVKKKLQMFDRLELYDNHKTGEERVVVRIIDDCIERCRLNPYTLMLTAYALPEFLKVTV